MNTRLRKISISLAALLFSLSAVAFADTSTTGAHKGHHRFWKEMKEVRQACAQANGFTLPTRGSGEQLSSADRTALRACVTEFRQNVQTCLQNAGISKPQSGQKPSDADKAAFKQCRTQALSEITGSSAGTPSSK